MADYRERIIPHSDEAERGILSCMLQSENAQAVAMQSVHYSEFYDRRNRMIFEGISRLYERGEPIDTITVGDELKDKHQFDDAGGYQYLGSLIDVTPVFDNVDKYCKIVHEKAVKRRLIDNAKKVIDKSFDTENGELQDLLDYAEGAIFNVSSDVRRSTTVGIRDAVKETMALIQQRAESDSKVIGINTGIGILDQMTSGLVDGNMTILAGRPSMGKTALAVNIMEHAAVSQGVSSMMFSLEMSTSEVVQRMLASLANVNLLDIRTGNLDDRETERLANATTVLQEAPITIDDQPFTTPLEVRAKARRVAKERGLDFMIVDYLQLMGFPNKGNREQEISSISRFLKGLAKEMNIPVLALSQLSRACEMRDDKRPILSDLRESGAIEQDADIVIFVFREEQYVGPVREDGENIEGIAELIVSKHRNGPTGKLTVNFDKEITKFTG